MKLFAISDLHLSYESNREALLRLAPQPGDWLIIAGDVGEREDHLRWALAILSQRFAQLFWVPGNHDLWTVPNHRDGLRGEAKYRRLVEICRAQGVLTPEDPFLTWPGPPPPGYEAAPPCQIAPLFVLYDYSFRPDEVAAEEAVRWAAASGIMAVDEALLHPDPHPSRAAWCAERCRISEERLTAAAARGPLVIVNHFPPRRDLLTLRRVPRFSIWCGTRRTEEWHARFGAVAVVYGHLHVRRTVELDGTRFEEVSLGYPRDWDAECGLEPYLREILPGPAPGTVLAASEDRETSSAAAPSEGPPRSS